MQKRIYAFLTALIILCNLFYVSVLAESNSEIVAKTNYELLTALGIDDDILGADEDYITRAQFAAMVVRATNNNVSVIDAGFTDVSDTDKFYREICIAKELHMTNGIAPNVFGYNEKLTASAALKMVIVALGYETIAEAKGGYPYGYMKVGSELDIFDGISSNDYITIKDAKLIVNNAIKADMALATGVDGDGTVIYTVEEGKNLLTEAFHLKEITGEVQGASYLTLTNELLEDNSIIISGNEYNTVFEPTKYFGMNVTAWCNKDNIVCAIEIEDTNNIVTVNAKDTYNISTNQFSADVDGKEVVYKLDKSVSYMENGRLKKHTVSDFNFSDGYMTLVDNDGDRLFEYIIAWKNSYYMISGKDMVSKTITDHKSSIGSICFEESGAEKCILTAYDGTPYNFDELTVGSVLIINKSTDGKVLIVKAGGDSVISAEITEISSDYFVADGKEYRTNNYFSGNSLSVYAGRKYDMSIAADGTVTYVTQSEDGGMEYGYLINASITSGLSAAVKVKLLTESGNISVFDLSKKLSLDGDSGKADSDAYSLLKNGEYPKYQLLRYRVGNDGTIVTLDTVANTVDTAWDNLNKPNDYNKLTKYVDKKSAVYRSNSTYAVPYFSMKKGIIFAVPKNLATEEDVLYSDDMFNVLTTSNLINNTSYTADAYDFDENYYPQAMVLYTETGNDENVVAAIERNSHIVYSITEAVNNDGIPTKKIKTASGGYYYTYYIKPERITALTSSMPSPGDVVRFEFNGKGEVIGISNDADYNAKSGVITVNYTDGTANGYISYTSGCVNTIGDGQISIVADYTPATLISTQNIATHPLKAAHYTVFDSTNNTVTIGAVTDVNTLISTKASKVLCRLNYYAVSDIFIYIK